MAKSIIKNSNIDLSLNTNPITLTSGEYLLATYDDDGIKDIFLLSNGGIGATIRVIGGISDEFTLQSDIAGYWQDEMEHVDGKIKDLTVIGRARGVRLNITKNLSGSIKMELNI